jgi:hypothetical protein
MVGPDLNQMLRTFEEVSPLLEGSDDCQHPLVVDLVIALDQTQALGVERDRVPLLVRAHLQENSAGGEVGTVCLEPVGLGLVR